MARYKLTSKTGVVMVTGSLAVAKRVASALATATRSEVNGESVSTPKRRRKKSAPKPARKKRRKKAAAPRRAKPRKRKTRKRRSRKTSRRR